MNEIIKTAVRQLQLLSQERDTEKMLSDALADLFTTDAYMLRMVLHAIATAADRSQAKRTIRFDDTE